MHCIPPTIGSPPSGIRLWKQPWGSCPPRLDVSQAQGLLAGQYGFLCQYDRAQGKDTVWSVLYGLGQGRIYRAEGNPSRTPFALDPRFPFAVG